MPEADIEMFVYTFATSNFLPPFPPIMLFGGTLNNYLLLHYYYWITFKFITTNRNPASFPRVFQLLGCYRPNLYAAQVFCPVRPA